MSDQPKRRIERNEILFALCLGLAIMSLASAVAIVDHVKIRPLEQVYNSEPQGAMGEVEHVEIFSPSREVRHIWLPSFLFLLTPVFVYAALICWRRRVSLRAAMLLVFAGATLAAIPSLASLRGDEHLVILYGGGFKMNEVDVGRDLREEKIKAALPPACWNILEIHDDDLRVIDWTVENPVKGRIRVWLAPRLSAEKRLVVLVACAYALHDAASWVLESREQRRIQRDAEMPELFSVATGRLPKSVRWIELRQELVTLRSHLGSNSLTFAARQALEDEVGELEQQERELLYEMERAAR